MFINEWHLYYNTLFSMINYQVLFSFHRIYEKHNRKKKLMLLPQFGTVELNAIFYGKPSPVKCFEEEIPTLKNKRDERMVQLVVTTYQMSVLDLFNDYNTLTYEVIYLTLFFRNNFS